MLVVVEFGYLVKYLALHDGEVPGEDKVHFVIGVKGGEKQDLFVDLYLADFFLY